VGRKLRGNIFEDTFSPIFNIEAKTAMLDFWR
jgi:hypothetical protein